MYIIGKASKYYTLWSVLPSIIVDGDGLPLYYQYAYIKNISMSRERACELYPKLDIDESIHGTRSFVKWSSNAKKSNEDGPKADEFHYGRYAGQKISDVINEEMTSNVSYVKWYYDTLSSSDEHKALVQAALISTGMWCLYNDMLITAEDMTEIREAELKDLELMQKINSNEPIVIVADKTMHYDDMIDVDESEDPYVCLFSVNGRCSKINVAFKTYKEMYYCGYYLLPTMNNKAVRYKNKPLLITKYHTIVQKDRTIIVADEFAVQK